MTQAHPLMPQRQHLAHQALSSSLLQVQESESASVRRFAKVGTTVLFDFDSAQLTDYAQRVLDRQAAAVKARPETCYIGGHADDEARVNIIWLWVSVVRHLHVIILSQKV